MPRMKVPGAAISTLAAPKLELASSVPSNIRLAYGYHVVKGKGGRVNGGGVYVVADCVVIPVARGYNKEHPGVADRCLEFFCTVLGSKA